ncbi:MAG TPA: hypothetical protein VF039_11920 [Longimicrobiales bacterium]
MLHLFRRIGFFRRRWIWAILLIGMFLFAGYWLVPWRGAAADLQLVAMRPDGTFAQSIDATTLFAEQAARDSAAGPSRGVPLVLAIANSGVRSGQPERLVLALPRWYSITTTAPVLRQEILPDEPLQRYVLELEFPPIESGRVPALLPAVDTLWLEPYVPDYWCTADADSIPQLIASTPPDTTGIVPVQIFWSFEGSTLDQRQTGLLTVDLPGRLFRRSAPVDITTSPVQMGVPEALRPGMQGLVEGGTRHSECGPPGDPMRVFSALWVTPTGGRMISVHYGGLPRKEYYDLNRDSIIELEMWDTDGDGEMEAWRELRVAIPSYLLPQDPISAADSIAREDSLRLAAVADSAARADSIAVARADSLANAARIAAAQPAPATPVPPRAGGPLPTLSELSTQLFPGNPATARRLFVPRRAPAPVRPRDDGPIGVPLGEAPPPARAEPAPPQPVQPEPTPEEPAPQPEDEAEEPDLIERVLQEAAEQDEDENR